MTEAHSISGNSCTLCNQAHTHSYTDHCEQTSTTEHEAFCWCGDSETQSHLYTDHYDYVSALFHKAYCNCGASEFQEHTLIDNECSECGTVHVHDYTEWEYYSNTQHIEKCSCGQVGTTKSVHAVRRTEIGRFKTCIDCGGLIDTFGAPNQYDSTVKMVTANGSYILPNGVIVLVDEDIEAYLNGELVFYNINDNSDVA